MTNEDKELIFNSLSFAVVFIPFLVGIIVTLTYLSDFILG